MKYKIEDRRGLIYPMCNYHEALAKTEPTTLIAMSQEFCESFITY